MLRLGYSGEGSVFPKRSGKCMCRDWGGGGGWDQGIVRTRRKKKLNARNGHVIHIQPSTQSPS